MYRELKPSTLRGIENKTIDEWFNTSSGNINSSEVSVDEFLPTEPSSQSTSGGSSGTNYLLVGAIGVAALVGVGVIYLAVR